MSTSSPNYQTHLCEVLSSLMGECDIDDAELSKQTGVPASTISRLRNNTDANPTVATLLPLAKYFDISINQLLGDEALPADRIPGTHIPTHTTTARIPVIKWDDLGSSQQNNDPINKIPPIDWISIDHAISKDAFALVVPTDSFGLAFRKGTLLICDPDCVVKDGDLILLRFKRDHEILFRQLLLDGNDVYLRSVNPELKGVTPLEKGYELIGVITETRYLPMQPPMTAAAETSIYHRSIVRQLSLKHQ